MIFVFFLIEYFKTNLPRSIGVREKDLLISICSKVFAFRPKNSAIEVRPFYIFCSSQYLPTPEQILCV